MGAVRRRPAFQAAVQALRNSRLRPQIEIDPTPAPQRLAPYAYALEAAVVDGDQTSPTAGWCCCTTRTGTTPGTGRSGW